MQSPHLENLVIKLNGNEGFFMLLDPLCECIVEESRGLLAHNFLQSSYPSVCILWLPIMNTVIIHSDILPNKWANVVLILSLDQQKISGWNPKLGLEKIGKVAGVDITWSKPNFKYMHVNDGADGGWLGWW